MPQRTCRGQRTACGSWASLFTVWFLSIETLILRLGGRSLYLWSPLFPRAAFLRRLQVTHKHTPLMESGTEVFLMLPAQAAFGWISVCPAPRLLSPLDEILPPLYTLKDPHTKENLRWGRGLNGGMSGSGDLLGTSQNLNITGCICMDLGALSSHLG